MEQITLDDLIHRLTTLRDVLNCGDKIVVIQTEDEPHIRSFLQVCAPTVYVKSHFIDETEEVVLLMSRESSPYYWTPPPLR